MRHPPGAHRRRVAWAAWRSAPSRDATPFVTTDGSTIRSLLDRSNAPVANQSLAEATIAPGESTVRHHHRVSEEIYYLIAGTGEMEIDGERSAVGPGDAILIPPGARHQITATGGGAAAAALRLRPALDRRGHLLRLSGPPGPRCGRRIGGFANSPEEPACPTA